MITLYTVPGIDRALSLSPFCAKLDAWLQLADVPFRRATANPREAPHGKVPYVDIDGHRMGDSQRIIEHVSVARDIDLDAWLDPRQRALGHLVRRTLEEATYFCMLHARWCTEHGFAFVREALLDRMLPALVRPFAAPLIRRGVRRQSRAQGTGRHSLDQIYKMGNADLEAIARVIGPGPFVLGERISDVDGVAYGFLSMIVHSPYDDPMVERARGLSPIVDYCERVAALLAEKAPPAEGA